MWAFFFISLISFFFLTCSLYFLESISFFFLKTTEFIFIFGLVASILNYNFLFSFVLFWVLFYFLQLQNHVMSHVDSIPTFLLAISFREPLYSSCYLDWSFSSLQSNQLGCSHAFLNPCFPFSWFTHFAGISC